MNSETANAAKTIIVTAGSKGIRAGLVKCLPPQVVRAACQSFVFSSLVVLGGDVLDESVDVAARPGILADPGEPIVGEGRS